MYNRYVPQPDGSYRRKQVRDPQPSVPVQKQEPRKEEDPCEEKKPECPPEPCQAPPETHGNEHKAPPETHRNEHKAPPKRPKEPSKQASSAFSFLRNLLPNDFDTGDLLIVMLLLLMAGDCEDGQNTALLTLALYLFM